MGGLGLDEELANAHLIAASLEMLGALKECVQSMDVARLTTFGCLSKVRAAIAKAEAR
jgi:hypothetical protein